MSTLVAQTISNGTVSTSSQNVIRGSARAWVRFDVTPSILESYNVSSISKAGAGNFTINFTNAMSSTTYPITASLDVFASNNGTLEPKTQSRTTTSFNLILQSTSNSSSPSYFDGSQINVAVFNT